MSTLPREPEGLGRRTSPPVRCAEHPAEGRTPDTDRRAELRDSWATVASGMSACSRACSKPRRTRCRTPVQRPSNSSRGSSSVFPSGMSGAVPSVSVSAFPCAIIRRLSPSGPVCILGMSVSCVPVCGAFVFARMG